MRSTARYFSLTNISVCCCSAKVHLRNSGGGDPMRRVIGSSGCPLVGSSRLYRGPMKPKMMRFGTKRVSVSALGSERLDITVLRKHRVTGRCMRTLGRCCPRTFKRTFIGGATRLLKIHRKHEVVKSCVLALDSFGRHQRFGSRVKHGDCCMSIRVPNSRDIRCGGKRSRKVPCHVLAPGKLGGLLMTKHYISSSPVMCNDVQIVAGYLMVNRTTKTTTCLCVGNPRSMRRVSASQLESQLGRTKRCFLWAVLVLCVVGAGVASFLMLTTTYDLDLDTRDGSSFASGGLFRMSSIAFPSSN